MLYFVNFEKEEGFAVVAGDLRFPQSLLCLTERGRINLRDLEMIGTIVDQDGNPITPNNDNPTEYPKSAPLIFETPRYPGEKFLNPLVGNFYVPAERDTLIGNYEHDWKPSLQVDDKDKFEDAILPYDFSPGEFVAYLCITYAKHENLRLAITDHLLIEPGTDPGNFGGGNGGAAPPPDAPELPIIPTTECTPWQIIDEHRPMLTDFTGWYQDGFYNSLYPERHSYILGKVEKAPAGCFPLSIAKLMAYHRTTPPPTPNGFVIDWDLVRLQISRKEIRDNKANLLFGVAEACQAMYFYNGTFVFPNKAINVLRYTGFYNPKFEAYNSEKAIQMFRTNRPTIIYGHPSTNVYKTHVWNIDGYKTQRRTKTIKFMQGTKVVKTETIVETQNMVHCDFGWNGNCNGYFGDEMFNFKSEITEFDNPDDKIPFTNYSTRLNILTY